MKPVLRGLDAIVHPLAYELKLPDCSLQSERSLVHTYQTQNTSNYYFKNSSGNSPVKYRLIIRL